MPSVKNYKKNIDKTVEATKQSKNSKPSSGAIKAKSDNLQNKETMVTAPLPSGEATEKTAYRPGRRRPGRGEEAGISSSQGESDGPLQTEFQGVLETDSMENVNRDSSSDSSPTEMASEVEPEYVPYSSDEEKVRVWEVPPQSKKSRKSSRSLEEEKFQIEFPYSELVRERLPGVFGLAESVAEEWVHDGNFEDLPVGHPLAQAVVGFGLRNAKKVEKTLDEKGVLAMAKIGVDFVKAKLKKTDR